MTPYVHWLGTFSWGVTSLPQGLQQHMRLTKLEGLLQGATSRGSAGYIQLGQLRETTFVRAVGAGDFLFFEQSR